MGDFKQNETQIVVISSGKNTFQLPAGVKAEGLKPYQQYRITENASPILNFLNDKGASKGLSSCLLIDKDGKVVLTNAADIQNYGKLLRQLQVASKVIMP